MSAYTSRVEANLKGLEFVSVGTSESCAECTECSDEGSFSWRSCGVCGSSLGGNRHVWHAVLDGECTHFDDACTDCVIYLANGEEPAPRCEECDAEAVDGKCPQCPYTLTLTADDQRTIAFVGGRYCWSDALAELGEGMHGLTEALAHEISEACESDGAWCPMLDPECELSNKLRKLIDSLV